jgi:hypothetical protein
VTGLAAVLAAAALGVAGWMWRRQWIAQPTGPGALGVAVKVGFGRSERDTIALATAAGIVLADPVAARLVEAVAGVAGLTGLDAAAWAPAGADVLALVVVVAAVLDVVVIGLWRGAMLRPALRHSLIGLALPAILVAWWPLLTQTAADARDAIGRVPTPAVCAPLDLAGDAVAGYGPEQLAHVATIVQVGREMGVPERGQVIAVATAMQESSLRNDAVGDQGTAFGVFQQRPVSGWGTRAEVTDVPHATRSFYTRLLRLRGWERLPLWQAAQAVQRSAHPTYYAKHEPVAAQLVGAAANTPCAPGRT